MSSVSLVCVLLLGLYLDFLSWVECVQYVMTSVHKCIFINMILQYIVYRSFSFRVYIIISITKGVQHGALLKTRLCVCLCLY